MATAGRIRNILTPRIQSRDQSPMLNEMSYCSYPVLCTPRRRWRCWQCRWWRRWRRASWRSSEACSMRWYRTPRAAVTWRSGRGSRRPMSGWRYSSSSAGTRSLSSRTRYLPKSMENGCLYMYIVWFSAHISIVLVLIRRTSKSIESS